jgi:hypothetical protein
VLNWTGARFWQEESYDHWAHNSASFEDQEIYRTRSGLGEIGQNAKTVAMVECLQVAPASACAVFRGQMEYPQSQESL